MKYEESGVNIDKANEANKAISKYVRSTWSDSVLSDVGSFGGLFRVPSGYENPVLVSSMDGVGTKLIVAQMAHRYDTIGQDLVNHCVNDIVVQGARPLFLLDYIAAGKIIPEVIAQLAENSGDLSSNLGTRTVKQLSEIRYVSSRRKLPGCDHRHGSGKLRIAPVDQEKKVKVG